MLHLIMIDDKWQHFKVDRIDNNDKDYHILLFIKH